MAGWRALEALVMADIWAGRRVFVTGHTGFKGSWLALWLAQLGAEVTGFALDPPTEPSLFEQAGVAGVLARDGRGTICDLAALEAAMAAARPEMVFHLAAQPLVRASYDDPVETYATNVMGTVNLLDACRRVPGIRGVVCVTSDKCYENREWPWPYRENDPMGGHDPYSSSKGAAELVISAYRRSYFGADGAPGIASVRAGNVIGGGDWAADRLVPDIVRALIAGRRPLIRAPDSIRPWQHVLEALSGYLMIAEKLLAGNKAAATAWNFGPAEGDTQPVRWIVGKILTMWGAEGWDQPDAVQPHEAVLLTLDSARARSQLGWRPALGLGDGLAMVVEWHKAVARGESAQQLCTGQLSAYSARRAAAGALA